MKRPPLKKQVIRQCTICGREQYDSEIGTPCERVHQDGKTCPGTWIKAPKVKRCPNCGFIYSARSTQDTCSKNCNPVFLETILQSSETEKGLK